MFKYNFNADNLDELRKFPGSEYEGVFRLASDFYHESFDMGITSIEYSAAEQKVIIRSAIGNPLPLFWGWYRNNLIVADTAYAVLNEIKGDGKINIEDLDQVGLLESILFDGPLTDRTLFERVKKVQTAEKLIFSIRTGAVERSWRWLPKIQVSSAVEYDKIKEEAIFHIGNLAKKIKVRCDGLTLPITGGLDSRLLASLTRGATDCRIHSYTFQRGWSYESLCARKVAKSLNCDHSIFNLGVECYRDFAKDVVVKSGGMVTGMHSHGIYCCEKLLPRSQQGLARMFGFYGDPVTGAMTEKVSNALLISSPEAIFEKYSVSLFPEVVASLKEKIVADLRETYDAFEMSGSAQHSFHEFWKIHQRQSNLITHLFHYHRAHHGVEVHEPFIDQDFIDFFLSLPLEQRFNRNLFKEVSVELFPEIFRLPSMHFKQDSLMAKIEHGFNRVEEVINKISPNQEFFLSPFRYEHHDKNLQNYLAEDVQQGVIVMRNIFSCKSTSVSYPIWKNSSYKEHYRLAALGYLVQNGDGN